MSDEPQVRGAHAPGGVPGARDALLRWVDEAGAAGRTFLQVRLLRTGEGRYEIRHARDVHRSLSSLGTVSGDPFRAGEIAQTTDAGEHRPLKTSPNLRQGWALVELDGRALWTALDYLYPACALHWHAAREGTLRLTHWRETAGRQSGMYAAVRLLSDEAVRDTVRACCDDTVCLRRPAWGLSPEASEPFHPSTPTAGDATTVPCPEACSIFVSFARKVLSVERSPRTEAPGLGRLAEEEVAQIRAAVDALAEGRLPDVREGDFDEPANQRRIRYLAARLARAGC